MAVYNEILVGRINRGLQKLLGMKGQAPAPQLSSDITAQLQVALGNEWRFLESWYRYGAVANVAAVVANSGLFRIFNPTAGGVIAVLEKLVVYSTGIADQSFVTSGTSQTALTNPVTVGVLDGRISGSSALNLSSSSGAAAGNAVARTSYPANGAAEFILFDDQEFVLTPGRHFDVSVNSVNQQIFVTVNWRERAIEESETK